MENEILDKETIQARMQILKLLKLAIAETRNLNGQLDNMHVLLCRSCSLHKVA